jgi:hypothetical protein
VRFGLLHEAAMMILWKILLCVILIFVGMSCKKDESNPVDPIVPGKRDYTWTRDTLFYLGNAQTTMSSMYATSPTNVYVVGHCEVSGGRMWRYDGSSWRPVNVSSVIGGFEAIDGTSPNDIWAVGGRGYFSPDSSYIIDSTLAAHFDGSSWRQVNVLPRRDGLWCLDVVSASVLFAAGGSGVLYKRDGNAWTLYEAGRQYFFSSIAAVSANEAYAFGHVGDDVPPVDSSGSFLFRFDGSSWSKIDSVMRTPNAPPARLGISIYSFAGTLYSSSPNVYQRTGTSWTKLVDAQVGHLFQSATNNIVGVGREVWHFNGYDWQQFSELGSTNHGSDCYSDGKEIFIVGNDGFKSAIIHGK